MARNARKSSPSRSGGSTLFGMLAGLIFGLAAAAGVAYFVTQVPMPFVDKASRDPAQTLLPDVRDAPDPNLGLYGRGSAAGVAPTGPADMTLVPLPGKAPAGSDNIGDLIASLTTDNKAGAPKPSAPAAKSGQAAAKAGMPATSPESKPVTPAKPASGAVKTTYYLQAGAFRSESDAETVNARILLMGLPAQVQKAQVNGSTINRVRVGPFKGIDDMNRARARLGEEKITSAVVRQ